VAIETTAEDLLEASHTDTGGFDVILVGDLFYERPLAERVLAFIEAARTRGAEVIVGDPRRSYFPADRFWQMAEYRVPVTRELEDAEIKRTAVWQLRHPGGGRDP
jgi:predicted nicotinamide N-methyase